jgi:hypothetical protein
MSNINLQYKGVGLTAFPGVYGNKVFNMRYYSHASMTTVLFPNSMRIAGEPVK